MRPQRDNLDSPLQTVLVLLAFIGPFLVIYSLLLAVPVVGVVVGGPVGTGMVLLFTSVLAYFLLRSWRALSTVRLVPRVVVLVALVVVAFSVL